MSKHSFGTLSIVISIEMLRDKSTFVFILDGFDEIKTIYDNTNGPSNFYERFELHKWRGKFIISCRSQIINDQDVNHTFRRNETGATQVHLAPFSKTKIRIQLDHCFHI